MICDVIHHSLLQREDDSQQNFIHISPRHEKDKWSEAPIQWSPEDDQRIHQSVYWR